MEYNMYQINRMMIESTADSTWTREEDKLFETALVAFAEDVDGRWQKIAAAVPGKTEEQVRVHYETLLHDLNVIESGLVELPIYPEDDENGSSDSGLKRTKATKKGAKHAEGGERKKGTPWTEQEHRKFLEGLAIYGRGDWRSISRNSVITRTSTQVASHAQKYFLRQTSTRNNRKRSSIHDITTTDHTPPAATNICNFQGIGSTGVASPQMGYEHQQNFGYPI